MKSSLISQLSHDFKEEMLGAERDAQQVYNDEHPENNASNNNFLNLYPFTTNPDN